MTKEEIMQTIKRYQARGGFTPDALNDLIVRINRAEEDLFPLTDAIDELGLWDVWHGLIEKAASEDPDGNYAETLSLFETLQKKHKALDRDFDSIISDTGKFIDYCLHAEFEDQMLFASKVLEMDAGGKLMLTAASAKNHLRQTAEEVQMPADALEAAYRLIDMILIFCERAEKELPLPPSEEDIKEWFDSHPADEMPANVQFDTFQGMIDTISKSAPSDIRPEMILAAYFAAASTNDPKSLDALLDAVDKKDVWNAYDDATDLMEKVHITDDGSDDEDTPTAHELAEQMRFVKTFHKAEQLGKEEVPENEEDAKLAKILGIY